MELVPPGCDDVVAIRDALAALAPGPAQRSRKRRSPRRSPQSFRALLAANEAEGGAAPGQGNAEGEKEAGAAAGAGGRGGGGVCVCVC